MFLGIHRLCLSAAPNLADCGLKLSTAVMLTPEIPSAEPSLLEAHLLFLASDHFGTPPGILFFCLQWRPAFLLCVPSELRLS